MSEITALQYVNNLREALDEKIPREAVATRSGGGGRSLSYLEGHYVIARLNKIFGQGNWAYGVTELTKVFEGQVKDKYAVSYITKGRLIVEFTPEVKTEFIEVGYGDGQDPYNPGKAHELAVKEAATDALKRCAKNLGMSMGLALYDKEQTNVDDGDEKVVVKAKADAKPKTNRTSLNSLLRNTAKVLIDKRKATAEDLAAELTKVFNVDKVDALSDTQASEFLKTLEARL